MANVEKRRRMNVEVLPDDEIVWRKARGFAGENGISLRELVFTALREKLRLTPPSQEGHSDTARSLAG